VEAYLTLPDGRRVAARDGLILGRVAGCDLIIDDSKCSRRHARIVMEGSVVEVIDLDSSNGTLLNGRPVVRRVLRDGDQIQIGATVVLYREGSAGAPAGAPAAANPAADDVDLFGGETQPAPPPPPPARRPSPTVPLPRPAAALPPAPPPPPAAPPAASDVVEFADEVVQVRSHLPAPRLSPVVAPLTGEPKIEKKQRILQFAKHADGKGVLGDDLEQLSGGARALVYAVVLAGAGGLAWLVMTLVR